MNKGFERFKKRLRIGALLKSLLFGLSCGTAAVAVYMAISKMQTYTPALLLCLAIGGGGFLVTGLIAFLVLFPSEKTIAKKLDHDLALDERVQTMLAFRGQENAMLTMQREDTDRRLTEAPAKKVRYRHAWRNLIAPVLATALMTVAVMTPTAAVDPPTPPEDEPTFEMTSFHETALLDLIEQVKASGMEEIPKGATVAVLEALLQDLKEIELKDGEVKQAVVSTIVAVNSIVNAANTSDEFYAAMNDSEIIMLSDMANAMSLLSGLQAKGAADSGREALRVDALADPLAQYAEGVESVLIALEDQVAPTDAAYVAMRIFAEGLRVLEGELSTITRDGQQKRLDGIFEALNTAMNRALLQQHTNRETGDMVVTTLMSVFELTEEDIPADQKPQQGAQQGGESQDKEDDELKDSQGGISDGELLFGGNDVIFDHFTNAQVKYGEVLMEYYKTVSEKNLNGAPSPELEQFISDYFKTLFDGSGKEPDKN